jgi:hypothetical protein
LLFRVTSIQICIEVPISSNSRNLLQFYRALLYPVKEKGGKTDLKPYPLPYGLRNPYRNLKSENSQDFFLPRFCPETAKKFYVSEFGCRCGLKKKLL